MGEEEYFAFDFEEAVRVSRDYKDDICNSMLKFYPTYMQDEKRFAKALFIKKYPSSLSDRFLTELATVPAHTVISIHVVPIPKDATTSTLQKKYMGIESDIIRQQREALNTALPIEVRQVETMRTLMTQSLAVLMPFNVQELYLPGKGGTYYGVNQVSRNILFGNRKRLVNGKGKLHKWGREA